MSRNAKFAVTILILLLGAAVEALVGSHAAGGSRLFIAGIAFAMFIAAGLAAASWGATRR